MNASQKAKWEQARAGGYWRYILWYWVVIFSGVLIIVKSIFNYSFSSLGLRLESMLIEAPIMLITAFIGGSVIWFITEKRYRKISDDIR
jgi:hypothetical protein